jgi:hypothetical protein
MNTRLVQGLLAAVLALREGPAAARPAILGIWHEATPHACGGAVGQPAAWHAVARPTGYNSCTAVLVL